MTNDTTRQEEENKNEMKEEIQLQIMKSFALLLRSFNLDYAEVFNVLANVFSRYIATTVMQVEKEKRIEAMNEILEGIPLILREWTTETLSKFEEYEQEQLQSEKA